MKLLDTNVILYAFGGPHAYREPCARILRAAETSDEYVIDVELLQEILHVFGRRGQRTRGAAVFDRVLDLFPDPLPVSRPEILQARLLFARYPSLSARDAIHTAVVVEHGLEGLVTADRDFDPVAEILRFDPLTM